MPRAGPRKVQRYSLEFKLKAVKRREMIWRRMRKDPECRVVSC